MIDVKTAKTCLLTEMASRLAADGFRALPREQVFRLAKPFGCWLVHLTFIPHRGVDLDVTASVAIRVDAVEELGNEHRNNLSAKYAKWTATLGAGLDNLSDVATGRWTMVSVNEAASVAEKICTEVRSIGYPFLERYSDLDNVLRLLTSLDSREWWLVPGHLKRCDAAVALAFLLGNPTTIESVIKSCEGVLAEREPEARPKFSEFVASLREKQGSGELPKLQ